MYAAGAGKLSHAQTWSEKMDEVKAIPQEMTAL
jgi:hypothetical protein